MRRASVSDVMTRDVVTVHPDTSFTEIVRLMEERRISGVPVLHPDGRILGVISESDLLAKERFKSPDPVPVHRFESGLQRRERERAEAVNAAELMSTPARTVTQNVSIVEAARLMANTRCNRLPVVDRDGQLVGIISRGDLLRLFLRPDEEIRDEVTNEVLQHYLWQDINLLRVEVQDGVVHLTGILDRRSLVPVAVNLALAVEGVVRVIEDLDYEQDDTLDRKPN